MRFMCLRLDNGLAFGFIGMGIDVVGVEVPDTSGESATTAEMVLWPRR